MFSQPGISPKEVWKYSHPANRQSSILLLTAAVGGRIGDGEGVGESLKGMGGGGGKGERREGHVVEQRTWYYQREDGEQKKKKNLTTIRGRGLCVFTELQISFQP